MCPLPVLLGSTTANMRWKSSSPCLSLPMLYPTETKHDLSSSGARRPAKEYAQMQGKNERSSRKLLEFSIIANTNFQKLEKQYKNRIN